MSDLVKIVAVPPYHVPIPIFNAMMELYEDIPNNVFVTVYTEKRNIVFENVVDSITFTATYELFEDTDCWREVIEKRLGELTACSQ